MYPYRRLGPWGVWGSVYFTATEAFCCGTICGESVLSYIDVIIIIIIIVVIIRDSRKARD